MFGDVGASEPPADDVAVLGLDQRAVVGAPGPRFGELTDVELVEQADDAVIDVLGAVVGVEAQNPEGEGGDEGPEHRDQEVFGDAGNGRKLLVLGNFVDHVDDEDSLLAVAVAGVDGVDAHEAGAALRTGLATHADGGGSAAGPPDGGSGAAVGPATAQVVDMAVGDVGQAREALVAEDFVLAAQDLLGGRSGELAEGLVHLGQQPDVGGDVDGPERPGGGTVPAIPDPARATLARDETAQLGRGIPGHLGEELPQQALAVAGQAEVVPEPDQGTLDERVGLPAVVEGDVGRFIPFQEGADVVEGANPFGAKCHDHAPMICPHPASCSLLAGNPAPALMLISHWTTLWLAFSALPPLPFLSSRSDRSPCRVTC